MEYFGSQTPSPSEVQEVYDFGSLKSSSPRDGAAFTSFVTSTASRRIYFLPDVLELDSIRPNKPHPANSRHGSHWGFGSFGMAAMADADRWAVEA